MFKIKENNCQKNKGKEKSVTEAGTAMKEIDEGEGAALLESKGQQQNE